MQVKMKKVKVEFNNITKKFNQTLAVNNVSCTFVPGSLTTLLGPYRLENPKKPLKISLESQIFLQNQWFPTCQNFTH